MQNTSSYKSERYQCRGDEALRESTGGSTTLQFGIHSESEHLVWKVELGGKKVSTVAIFPLTTNSMVLDGLVPGTHISVWLELFTLNVLIFVHQLPIMCFLVMWQLIF